MDTLGIAELQSPLTGTLLHEAQPQNLESLNKRLEWFLHLDRDADALREELATWDVDVVVEIKQELNRQLGVATAAQERSMDQRLADQLVSPFIQRISDAIIIAVPIRTPLGFIRWRAMNRILIQASVVFLKSLAHGHPMRASAAVGIGCVTASGSLLGPVLQEAYQLEHNPPRLLAATSHADRDGASMCLAMLYQDESGEHAVDYAGSSDTELSRLIRPALAKSLNQLERWRADKSPRGIAISTGWERTVRYLRSRLLVAGTPSGW
jgi:hypothetical protein